MKEFIDKLKLIIKSLSGSFMPFVFLLISTIMVTFVLGIYEINDKSHLENGILEAENIYGRYHMLVTNCSETMKKEIEKDNISEIVTVEQQDCNIKDGHSYSYLYCKDESIFDISEFALSEGTFPKKEDEILAEKWYLLSLGIAEKDMIGSIIEMYNPLESKTEKLKVTGIIKNKNNLNEDEAVVNVIFIRKHIGDVPNSRMRLYVRYKNLDDISIFKYQNAAIEGENISENEGILESESKYSFGWSSIDEAIIKMLFIIMLVSIYNVIKLFVRKNIEVINIFKLIGIPIGYISLGIIILTSVVLIVGMLIGVGYSVGALKIIYEVTYNYFDLGIAPVIVLPYKDLLLQAGIVIITQIVVILFVMVGYVLKTPAEKISATKNKKVIFRKGTLYNDRYFKITKKTFRNITTSLHSKGGVIVVLCIMIVSEFLSVLEMSRNEVFKDSNDKYEYKVNFYTLMDGVKGQYANTTKFYRQVSEICKEDDVLLNILWQERQEVNISRECLNEAYIHKISLERYNNENALDGIENIHDVELWVMGYTEPMIRKICEDNNLNIELNDGEMILMSRTVNKDSDMSYPLNKIPQTIKIDNMWDLEKKELKVVGCVDDSLVYPYYDGNYLLGIVTEETFRKYFTYEDQFPEMLYLDSGDKNTINKIYSLAAGKSFVKIYNQHESSESVNKYYYQKLATYIIMFIMCVVAITINLILIQQFDFEINRKNLAMEHALGISKGVQAKAVILENFVVYVAGILIGAFVIYIINILNGVVTLNVTRILDIKIILIIQVVLYMVAAIIAMISSIVINSKIKIPDDLEG